MSDAPDTDDQAGQYDPSVMAGSTPGQPIKLNWYRRPWFLVTAGVAAVIVASVIVDLPHPTSTAEDVAAETGLVKQVNTDITPCAYGLGESFTIYKEMKANTLTASDRVRVPALLRDDQTACSFTSQSIYDLSSIQPSGTNAGKSIGQLISLATTWSTSDALAAIEDIQTIDAGSGTAATTADLYKQERLLTSDRAQALAQLATADRLLGNVHLPTPNLPVLPKLPGS
jgi:hypothetical protein